MSSGGVSPVLKYVVIAIVVLILVWLAFWVGRKDDDSEPTPTPVVVTQAPEAVYVPPVTITPVPPAATSVPTSGSNAPVGNQVGNRAPDFQLKDSQGNAVALRNYRGQTVILAFREANHVTMTVGSQDMVLTDANMTVHRLYSVTSMPY